MSFGQELKDFLAAAAAGQKIMGAASDEEYKKVKSKYQQSLTATLDKKLNDKEGDEAAHNLVLAQTRNTNASAAASNARVGLLGKQGAYTDARTKALTAAPAAVPVEQPTYAIPVERPGQEPAPGPQSAVDTGPVNQDVAQSDIPDDETEAVPTAYGSRGGSIQHFEDGGSVEEEDDPSDDGDDDVPAPAVGGSTDVSAQSRTFSHDAAHDAVTSGLKYGVSALGLNQPAAVRTPGRSRALQAYAQGAGAADAADMQAAQKAVDPKGQMGESERNLAALSAVYQYKMGKGDTVGAQRAAFSMVQYYRQASQRYAAIAAAAAEHGDVSGAAKAAMKAYSNIPDGKDFKVTAAKDGKLSYSFTDEKTGRVISQGIADPAQMASAAMGVAKNGFDQFLLAAAGERAPKSAKGKGAVDPSAGLKPNDAKNVDKAIGEHLDKVYPENDADGKPLPKDKYDPSKAEAWRVGAYQIQSANPDLHPRQAIKAANDIMFGFDDKDPKAKPFEIEDGEDGKKKIKFPGTGTEITMSSKQLAPLMVQRGAEAKRLAAEAEKTKKDGAEEGTLSKMGKAVSDGVGAAADWVKDDLSKGSAPETIARVKSAVGAVGRAASDAKDWVVDDLKKPPIWGR